MECVPVTLRSPAGCQQNQSFFLLFLSFWNAVGTFCIAVSGKHFEHLHRKYTELCLKFVAQGEKGQVRLLLLPKSKAAALIAINQITGEFLPFTLSMFIVVVWFHSFKIWDFVFFFAARFFCLYSLEGTLLMCLYCLQCPRVFLSLYL